MIQITYLIQNVDSYFGSHKIEVTLRSQNAYINGTKLLILTRSFEFKLLETRRYVKYLRKDFYITLT